MPKESKMMLKTLSQRLKNHLKLNLPNGLMTTEAQYDTKQDDNDEIRQALELSKSEFVSKNV